MTDERREHERLLDPLVVVRFSSGEEFCTVNWTYGGMLLNDYDGDLGAGALLTISDLGPSGGPMIAVNIKARVVRADCTAGHLALAFLDIDKAGYSVLRSIHG